MDVSVPTIVKTDATVLRIAPFSRTSHVVTWLSPNYGRLATVVKGACRPTSAFLGQYDLFTTCELLFYRRERDGVHIIRECSALAARNGLRNDWRRVTTASYLCDLTARVTPPLQEAAGIHALLAAELDRLCATTPDESSVLRVELALLRQLGLMPQLSACPHCHPLGQTWVRFGLASGHALCAHRGTAAAEATVTVQRDVLDALQHVAASGLPEPVQHLSLGLRRFLGIFLRFHLDVPAAPRRLAFELLNAAPAAWTGARGEMR